MMRNRYSVFGHPLTLDLPQPTVQWISLRWPQPGAQRKAFPIHIGQGAVAWSEGADGFECSVFDRLVRVQLGGDGFALRCGEAILRAELRQGAATLRVSGPAADTRILLWAALSEMVRLGGLLPLHAAGLARDGRCAVLVAPSGTGKSTTLVSAALSGYRAVAEDMLWVDPATLDVFGNDREVRLWGDSLERFQGQLPAAAQRPSDGKFAVPLAALPQSAPEGCKLHRLVVLRRDLSRDSCWEQVTQLELVRSLWESSCVPLTRQARQLAEAGISTLCRKVAHAGLLIGATPLDFAPMLD